MVRSDRRFSGIGRTRALIWFPSTVGVEDHNQKSAATTECRQSVSAWTQHSDGNHDLFYFVGVSLDTSVLDDQTANHFPGAGFDQIVVHAFRSLADCILFRPTACQTAR